MTEIEPCPHCGALPCDWTDNPHTAPSGDVERVARAINPHIWGCYDCSLVPFVEERGARSSTDDCTTYEMMWKDGCRTVEDAKNWWLTTDRPVMVRVYHFRESLRHAQAAIAAMRPVVRVFSIGDRVTKIKGSAWTGRVVGTYSTTLTPEGYAVESENEPGSVQIYPATALRQAEEG